MFLIAALVERELAADGDEAKKKAARQAIDWLNRAEKVLPGTRALYAHRCEFWGLLGDREADKADKERALKIKPTSAVDHFWHGYAHHLRGHEARRRKDAKAARDFYHQEVAEYAALLRLRPDHFWGYFNWAVCQAQLGEAHDLHDDLVRFTACIRLRPDLPWPYNNRGTIHLNLKEHDLAVTDFTAALARNDQYAEAHANRGLALAAQGKDDAALEDFGKAIALNPDYAPARAERVKIFVKRKQYAEAVRDQDRLVALNPKDLPARATRAELCIAAGDYLKARDDLTQILAAAPKAAPVWRARAVLNWQKLKDFDAAIKDFEQFAQLAPKDPEPHRCIGAILLGRRQYDRAEEALRKAVALRPGYAEALWGLAQIDLWRNRPEEALKRLDPLVAKLPAGPPETLNVRGDVYRAMGRLDDAAADYRRMIELKPKEPDAYVSLAGICERQGKLQLTRDCYERLVKAAPESARSYLCRAEFRRAQKEYGAALADCDQAAMREPASPLPALVRAGIEASRGRPEIATADAERALARAPKDDGQALYAAARAWSLAAGAETDAARAAQDSKRAAALLAQVFDRGFHDLNYPQHNRMADDPALAAVRQVPGVRDLLAHRPAGK
ncbi:MAG TPA: tetratricopeptide repeat protein [Gemmataceae bacterium]|nr:tetratricopeptide repeat protein [Gemmataceae bacterium]